MSNIDSQKPQTETYHDKYAIPKIPLGRAMRHIDRHLRLNITRGVICLISEAGEGKSQGIRQLARKHNRRVVDIRTSQFTLMGAGIPQRADEATGMFKIAVPDEFPKPGEKAILLFDEINQGQPHAISMFFKMLEDRGMFNYELPEDCVVIALMNPSSGGYSVSKIETNRAITRRLKKFYVYNTFGDWVKHAESDEFHHGDAFLKGRPCYPWVLRFLRTEPSLLYAAKDRDGDKAFACPATWQTVSADLYALESEYGDLTDKDTARKFYDEAEEIVGASVNTVMAHALVEYMRNNAIRISPEEVLKNYKPKSALRKRILEMQKEPDGNFANIVGAVAAYLFSEECDPKDVSAQLVPFMNDMPIPMLVKFRQDMAACADTAEKLEYAKRLTREMQTYPEWMEMVQRSDAAFNQASAEMSGKAVPRDPLKSGTGASRR